MEIKPVLKFKLLSSNAKLPEYAHKDDAGMDVYSIEEKTLTPGERYIFKTGISAEIPEGYFISIRDKSSVPAKFGLHTMGGVIDAGYRGELGIIMINLGQGSHTVQVGDKIAQAVLQPVAHAEIVQSEELSQTQRGEGGFGSTGKN